MRTTVILKTDIVDSTPRTAAQTQAEMGLHRKQHKRLISETAVKNNGAIFQEEGDANWIEFPSVTTAVLAALEIHQALRAQQTGKGEKQRLAIRAVIAVGDILYQENDTIGTTMALTARIEKVTPSDEIYLSHAAWLVFNNAEVQTSFVGEFEFKGFSRPERVYRVDQKHRTRVLSDHLIVYTDSNQFGHFVRSAGIEEVECFLLDCDDLLNELCEKHAGTIRQVHGDEYFLTFIEKNKMIHALEDLCNSWRKMVEKYGMGISIGVHRGNLNVIRSYVYGDDIHTTTYLTELAKLYHPGKEDIYVTTSRRVRDEFQDTKWAARFQKLDGRNIPDETYRRVIREHGAYRFLLE